MIVDRIQLMAFRRSVEKPGCFRAPKGQQIVARGERSEPLGMIGNVMSPGRATELSSLALPGLLRMLNPTGGSFHSPPATVCCPFGAVVSNFRVRVSDFVTENE